MESLGKGLISVNISSFNGGVREGIPFFFHHKSHLLPPGNCLVFLWQESVQQSASSTWHCRVHLNWADRKALGNPCQSRMLHPARPQNYCLFLGNVIFPSYKCIKLSSTAKPHLQFQLTHCSSSSSSSSWSIPHSSHPAAFLEITLPTPTQRYLAAHI